MFERVTGWLRRHPVWSGIAVLAIGLVGWGLFGPEERTYAYVTEQASRGPVVSSVTASGKLRALNTIKVGAEVSGQVTRVLVDFNSQVTAGQVLAEIDPTRFRARVQQAQAQVAHTQGVYAAKARAALAREAGR